ncbi:MAG: LCP family protein [Candidatus Doudnabacteria bacterium]|nr:LCP family protein [Candidatus Doudnabacteria bacterium]
MRTFDGINTYASNSYPQIPDPKKPKRRLWKWLIILLIIVGGTLALGGSKILSKTNQIFTNKQNIFVRVGKLLISDDKPLQGEESGVVNVLLLGMGGPGHEGPYLTDTMIVASINVQTKEVLFTSIPRDFLVQIPGRGFNKINAAYAYAEMDNEGSGGPTAIQMAEKVTGLKIPYYAAIDFKGFVKAVDHVGGLDITIDRTFTDSSYPNYNYGYLSPQTFTSGQEHMDGERALIFARSRKGNNGEGSDFARSERQKKIMVALRDELMQLKIGDLTTINNLLGDFTENFRTNFEPHELKRLADLGKDINGDSTYSVSLEPDNNLICDGLIDMSTGRPAPPPVPTPEPTETDTDADTTTDETDINTETPKPEEPAITRIYVVQPCEGVTLTDISNHLMMVMDVAKLQKEDATIEIINTTGKSYVTDDWKTLSSSGVTVKFSTGKTIFEKSMLYDNTQGKMPKTLEYLQSNYSLSKGDLPYNQSTADFVIILGKDAL